MTYASVATAVSNFYNEQATIRQPTSLTNTLSGTFQTVDTFLTGIAGISLVVAGIGIIEHYACFPDGTHAGNWDP